MRQLLFILTFLVLTNFVNSQSLEYDTTFSDGTTNWKASVKLPSDYYTSTKEYKLIMFIPGAGEIGGGYAALDTYGPLAYIDGGWTGAVELGNGTHYPILIALEPYTDYVTAGNRTANVVAAIVGRYRVQSVCVSATGFSAGSYNWKIMVTEDTYDSSEPYGPFSYADKIAALADVQGVIPDDNAEWYIKVKNFARNQYAGRYLGIWDNLDGSRGIDRFVDSMNAAVASSGIEYTTSYGHDSDAWNALYGSSAGAAPVNFVWDGSSQNVYQWLLRQGDTTFSDPGAGSLEANAGSDQTYAYNQAGDSITFSVAAASSNSEGTVTYSWAVITGNPSTTNITSPTDSATTITGADVSGYYQYELTVTDDNGSDKDTIIIWLRDWMEKNVTPCRSGTKQKFTIGDAVVSGVTSTSIYIPYINRDTWFGSAVQGGDTIEIVRNPNNSGVWEGITIGDFGGSQGCPVVVVSDSVTTFIDYFRVGTLDSNFVVHAKFDGLANRLTKGVVYGFQYEDQGVNNPDGIAFNANYTHHLEINGMSVINTGVGIFIKKNSDSTKVSTLYDNFRFQNININNIYLHRINGEGTYIGHTDIAGNLQAGNDGPTIPGDTLQMSYIIADSTFWDGLQTSNVAFGVTTMKHIVTNRTGTGDVGAQQFAGFLGGGTSNGSIDSSVFVNGTGAVGMLGKGTSYLRYCIIDSIYTSDNSADGVYASMSVGGLPTPLDSAINIIENNIISRPQRYAVNVANNSGANKGDTIRNNQFVHATKTVNQLINDVAAGYDTGNTVVTAMDLDTSSLATMPAYRVYSELLRVQPSGTKISFFDLEEPEEPAQPPRGFKLRGIRLKLN